MSKFYYFILTKVLGWHFRGVEEISPTSVVAVFPHTSYWDGVIGYIAMRALNINFKVMSAEWLFFWPFKYIMKYVLHAFPVGKKSGNAIKASLKIFEENQRVNLVICPEGQLAATDKWNPGFLYIAQKAKVPVDVVILDYWHKNIYIRGYNSDMCKETMFAYMNRDAKECAWPKHKDKFLLHKIN